MELEKEYHVKDWTGNILFEDKTFYSFEDGWAYILENVKDEGDNTYDDYFVEETLA